MMLNSETANIEDKQSIGSSVEIHDAAINESWDWASVQRRLRDRRNDPTADGLDPTDHAIPRRALKNTRLNMGADALQHQLEQRRPEAAAADESWVGSLWRWWNEWTINGRLQQYDEDESRHLVSQRLARVAAVYADECTRAELCQLMLCSRLRTQLQQETAQAQSLRRRYGQRMAQWVALYAQQVDQQLGGGGGADVVQKKGGKKALLRAVKRMRSEALERAIQADVGDQLIGQNSLHDPLMGWFRQRQDWSGRMLARIQNLAAHIAQQVAWSFLIEPGRPKTDLSRFYAEFDVLDNFFDKVQLTAEECAQKAFDANSLFKVRNRKLVCVDWSRVRLAIPAELTQEGVGWEQLARVSSRHRRRAHKSPAGMDNEDHFFGGTSLSNEIGFGGADFINASRVMGGPLLNSFILTQAPLPHTMADFWRMVWQEQSEWIFMLCEASTDPNSSNNNAPNNSGGGPSMLLDQLSRTHCPFYWPRFEDDVLRFGRLHVRNAGVDMAVDPLFTVTHLELWVEEDPQQQQQEGESDVPGPSTRPPPLIPRAGGPKLRLQHWQWDWRNHTDLHWPFRILLRARHSKRPTILMCADGCGRSGTVALIEIVLMQLLRGAVSPEQPMLTAGVFLRLQRRHAVANRQQWLFAYRCVLHWLQPFVISWYHRLVLGFTLPGHGFCAKYEECAQAHAHRKSLSLT